MPSLSPHPHAHEQQRHERRQQQEEDQAQSSELSGDALQLADDLVHLPIAHDGSLQQLDSNAFVCRATISSSLVGMIQMSTRLAAALIRASPVALWLRLGSSMMPNQSRFAQTIARIRCEFSPIPPVNTIASAPFRSRR